MISLGSWKKRVVALVVAAAACTTGGIVVAGAASAATCADVEVVFARGSGEFPGLGIVGGPFVNAVKANLPGKVVNSYAVNYAADYLQTSAGAGATDMTRHIKSVAATCPTTKFAIGGYSQGASVTDIAIGISTFLGSGEKIPVDLAPRIAAVVVFGNPLGLFLSKITTASPLYGPKAKEYCNAGDPVCELTGFNVFAHITYGFDSAANGGKFAADKVLAPF